MYASLIAVCIQMCVSGRGNPGNRSDDVIMTTSVGGFAVKLLTFLVVTAVCPLALVISNDSINNN